MAHFSAALSTSRYPLRLLRTGKSNLNDHLTLNFSVIILTIYVVFVTLFCATQFSPKFLAGVKSPIHSVQGTRNGEKWKIIQWILHIFQYPPSLFIWHRINKRTKAENHPGKISPFEPQFVLLNRLDQLERKNVRKAARDVESLSHCLESLLWRVIDNKALLTSSTWHLQDYLNIFKKQEIKVKRFPRPE